MSGGWMAYNGAGGDKLTKTGPSTGVGPRGAGPRVTQGRPPQSGAAPNWLGPMSMQQIIAQARNTISKAYAPGYLDLNQQSKQARAISDKRASDNRYYQSWLDSQMQALQSHADASTQQLTGLEQQLQGQQQSLYGAEGNLATQADQRQGNVSNNAQSTALGPELGQNQQTNMGLLNSASQAGIEGAKLANDQLSGARANNLSLISNMETSRIGDLNKALTTIGQARAKLNSSKIADIAKEIARLQGVQISVAQSNRDFAAVQQKLGLQAAETSSLINSRNAATKLAGQRLNLDLTKAQLDQMNKDRQFQLDKQKFGAQQATTRYEQAHGLGPFRPSKSGSGGSTSHGHVMTLSQITSLEGKIDGITGQVNQMISTYGLTPQQAYHYLQNGGYVNGPVGANGKPTKVHINPVGNIQLLNAAYNLRNGGSGLSPGDLAALQKMGWPHPEKRYRVNHPTSPGIGNWRT